MAPGPLSFAIRVIRGRWFTFFASLLINATSGSLYVFAIYSNAIKSSLGYDQRRLNTVSFFKDLGASVGIPAGLIYEVTPPWLVLAVGSVTNLFGYLMLYLAITGHLARPHLWQVCLYICIGANSQSFTNTGSVVTSVKNFPGNRGIVLGLLKGFAGLSGAIFAQLYLGFYGGDSRSLVLLIAWLPSAIVILFLCVIRVMKARRPGEPTKPFYHFLYISIALAIYIMVMSLVQKRFTFSRSAYRASATIALLLLSLLTLAVVVKEEFQISKQKDQLLLPNPPPPTEAVEVRTTPQRPPPPTAPSPSTRTLPSIISIFRAPERGEDYSIPQALVSIDMAVLFTATVCGVGGALTAFDNMGQIGESLGYSSQSISTFVSLISIWNFAGRVAAGFISDILLAKYRLPRPLILTTVLLLCCVGHLLIAFGVPSSLYVASLIIGLCYGAMVPLIFVILSEVFGLKYFSTFYNVIPLASPIGSYILNVRVTGYFYDREAAKQSALLLSSSSSDDDDDEPLACVGVRCFKFSFLIITAVTVFGALALLVLVRRTWGFYKEEIHARFREGPPNSDGCEERRQMGI